MHRLRASSQAQQQMQLALFSSPHTLGASFSVSLLSQRIVSYHLGLNSKDIINMYPNTVEYQCQPFFTIDVFCQNHWWTIEEPMVSILVVKTIGFLMVYQWFCYLKKWWKKVLENWVGDWNKPPPEIQKENCMPSSSHAFLSPPHCRRQNGLTY